MVQQLMRAENMRLDRLTRRRTHLQWRQEDLRGAISHTAEWRNRNTSINNMAGGITDSRVWNTSRTAVTAATGSHTSGVTVHANNRAPLGSMSVRVESYASRDVVMGNVEAAERLTSGGLSQRLFDFLGADAFNSTQQAPLRDASGRALYDVSLGGETLRMHETVNATTGVRTLTEVNIADGQTARRSFTLESGGTTWQQTGDGTTTFDNNAVAATQRTATYLDTSGRQTFDIDFTSGSTTENLTFSLVSGTEANGNRVMVETNPATGTAITLREIREEINGETVTRWEQMGTDSNTTVTINSMERDRRPVYETNVEINGRNILINSEMTIQQFMNAVNANENMPNISFNTLHRQLTFTAQRTGAEGNATTVRTGGDGFGLLSRLGLADIGAPQDPPASAPDGTVDYDSRVISRASQAVLIVNDGSGEATVRSDTNSVSIGDTGITINLTSASQGAEFTIGVTRNVDNTVEAIRRFVDEYNDLIRYLNAMHTTARPRQGTNLFFEPLTDAQRQEMSERDATRWEEQARIGMLHRDQDLRNLQDDIRRGMMEPVRIFTENGPSTLSLHQIGITTGGGTGQERLMGLLQIDEDALRRALQERPNDVEGLFTERSFSTAINPAQRNARRAEQGIGPRLDDILANSFDPRGTIRNRVGVHGMLDTVENPMSRQITEYNNRIDNMQRWLFRRENQFFTMFSRMEQAMAQANAQMDSLMMFGAM
jgi:flagellar capping protein FliD